VILINIKMLRLNSVTALVMLTYMLGPVLSLV